VLYTEHCLAAAAAAVELAVDAAAARLAPSTAEVSHHHRARGVSDAVLKTCVAAAAPCEKHAGLLWLPSQQWPQPLELPALQLVAFTTRQ